MDVNVSQADGQVTVTGPGWQLDVFEASRTWVKPDGATDAHVILKGAGAGTAEGDGPPGIGVVFTEFRGDGGKRISIHGAQGAGGSGRRSFAASDLPDRVPVTIARGGAGGTTAGAPGQAGQGTHGGQGGAGGAGGATWMGGAP